MANASFTLYKVLTDASSGGEEDTLKNPGWLSANVHDLPATYPVAIPETGGTVYSYENYLVLELTALPDTACENFKVFGPATQPATGLTVYMGVTVSFSTPVATVSSVATTRQDTNYYSAGTALDLTVDSSSAQITNIGDRTDYLVVQLKVESTASSGVVPTQAFYVQWDES